MIATSWTTHLNTPPEQLCHLRFSHRCTPLITLHQTCNKVSGEAVPRAGSVTHSSTAHGRRRHVNRVHQCRDDRDDTCRAKRAYYVRARREQWVPRKAQGDCIRGEERR